MHTFKTEETAKIYHTYGTRVGKTLRQEQLKSELLDMCCITSTFVYTLALEDDNKEIQEILKTGLTEIVWSDVVLACLKDVLVQEEKDLQDGEVTVFGVYKTDDSAHIQTFTGAYSKKVEYVFFTVPARYEVIGYWQGGAEHE